jgi:phenylacetate-CoA ligase
MQMWDPQAESLSRRDLEQIQLERLQASVNRAYKNVAFYYRRFHQLGLHPEDIQSLRDLSRLPFTTKDDLRDNYPYDMLAVPLREVVRLHASSGTTGKPTVCGYTAEDLKTWADLVARVLTAGGVTKDDLVQISFGYGLFTGAFGHHYGAERIGASVIPASVGNTERQVRIMQDFRTTALVGTPSYALHIAEVMEDLGVNPKGLSLRVGLFGSEPWSERMRQEIQTRLNLSATDNYGLSEVLGPGVSGECECKNGLHLAEDHFLPEIVDPDSGEPLPPGSEGELVLTTLTREAIPILRFRTRDITSLNPEPCACGRTLVRMKRVMHRTDDMLIIRGVNVFPSQVEAILAEIEGVQPHYQIILDRKGALDDFQILVEVSPQIFAGEVRILVEMEEFIRSRVGSELGVSPQVKLVEPRTLERSLGKARRVIDRREL